MDKKINMKINNSENELLHKWKKAIRFQLDFQKKVKYTLLRRIFQKVIYSSYSPFIKPGLRILNLGSGRGQVNSFFKNTNFINIDPLYQELNMDSLTKYKILAIGETTPFKKETFNVIIMNSVIHNLIEPQFVFKELRRILKNDGILIIQEALSVPIDNAHLRLIKFEDFLSWTELSELSIKKHYFFGIKFLVKIILAADNRLNNNFLSLLLLPFLYISLFLPKILNISGYICILEIRKN